MKSVDFRENEEGVIKEQWSEVGDVHVWALQKLREQSYRPAWAAQ